MQTFVSSGDAPFTELGGGTRRRILAHSDALMAVEVRFDTGAAGSDHSHPHTQISYVLCGEFSYHIEGESHTMKPGDSIVVPGGSVHGCTCVSAGALLDVFTPMREDFLK